MLTQIDLFSILLIETIHYYVFFLFQIINEDAEERMTMDDLPIPDLIPSPFDQAHTEENLMSISTLHLYDMHLAKVMF